MRRRIAFYADEHSPRAVIRGLRVRGVEVLTVTDAGTLTGADAEHLERARIEGMVLVTQDTDFLALHAAGAPHCRIVYTAQGTSVGDIIRGLMLIFEVLGPHEMIQQLEFL